MSKNVENSCLNSPQKIAERTAEDSLKLHQVGRFFSDVARSGASSRSAVHVMSHSKSKKMSKSHDVRYIIPSNHPTSNYHFLGLLDMAKLVNFFDG